MKNSRRRFIKNIAGASAALALGGVSSSFTAKSYRRIIGANGKTLLCHEYIFNEMNIRLH